MTDLLFLLGNFPFFYLINLCHWCQQSLWPPMVGWLKDGSYGESVFHSQEWWPNAGCSWLTDFWVQVTLPLLSSSVFAVALTSGHQTQLTIQYILNQSIWNNSKHFNKSVVNYIRDSKFPLFRIPLLLNLHQWCIDFKVLGVGTPLSLTKLPKRNIRQHNSLVLLLSKTTLHHPLYLINKAILAKKKQTYWAICHLKIMREGDPLIKYMTSRSFSNYQLIVNNS